MTDTSAQAAAPSPSTVRKVALAAMAGSAIEWYDFFIYLTAAALVFGPLFFPGASEVAAVLASFSTAAVGFVARPVGGILLGHFGDKLGRKPTLVIALLTMGTATTLVGLLPTYATIGVAAPIILFVLRFCQGSPAASGAGRSCWRRSTLPRANGASTGASPRWGFPSGSSSGTASSSYSRRSWERPRLRRGAGAYRSCSASS